VGRRLDLQASKGGGRPCNHLRMKRHDEQIIRCTNPGAPPRETPVRDLFYFVEAHMAALEVDSHSHDNVPGRTVGMRCRRARPLGEVGLCRVVLSEDGRNFFA
jgi:hypothetical protein